MSSRARAISNACLRRPCDRVWGRHRTLLCGRAVLAVRHPRVRRARHRIRGHRDARTPAIQRHQLAREPQGCVRLLRCAVGDVLRPSTFVTGPGGKVEPHRVFVRRPRRTAFKGGSTRHHFSKLHGRDTEALGVADGHLTLLLSCDGQEWSARSTRARAVPHRVLLGPATRRVHGSESEGRWRGRHIARERVVVVGALRRESSHDQRDRSEADAPSVRRATGCGSTPWTGSTSTGVRASASRLRLGRSLMRWTRGPEGRLSSKRSSLRCGTGS